MRKSLLAGVPALVLLATLSACGDDEPSASDDTSGSPSDSPSATPTDDGGDDAGAPSSPSGNGVACNFTPDGTDAGVDLPPATAAYDGPVEATIETTAGNLEVTLDGENAPCTVSSFLSLAEQGYFDDTPCHRLTSYPTLSVLQCGDPTGQGTGGPGYTIPDELDSAGDYSAGVLAMANTGQPDSGGSQFFVVYADSDLPAQYTVFGRIDEAGIKVVSDLAADGSTPEQDGAPNTPVSIVGVTER